MSPALSRRIAAAMIALAGLIHLLLVSEYLEEKAYIGVLFIVSVPLCALVALRLWRRDDAVAWALGAAVSAGMAVAFVVSRTVGLPGFDESGEWELSGLASVAVELVFVALAARALVVPDKPEVPRPVSV